MAGEIINSNITLGIFDAFGQIPGVSFAVKVAQALGILAIIYIIFLIFKAIIQARQSLRLKKIAQNVEEINQKLDILIGKKGKK